MRLIDADKWCENIDRGTSDNFYCANGKQLNKESEGKE